MKLEFNLHTFVAQIILFIILFGVLKNLFFDPILKVLRRRESLTVGKKSDVEKLLAQTQELQDRYDQKLRSLLNELDLKKKAEVTSLTESLQAQVKEAEAKAKKRISEHEILLQTEINSARARVQVLSDEVSRDIVQAISESRVVHA